LSDSDNYNYNTDLQIDFSLNQQGPEIVRDSWSIQVSKLPTNIEARMTEDAVTAYLEQFSDIMQKPPEATNSYMLKLITQTYDTIHSAAQEIYYLGVKYAALKDRVNPRLTTRDLTNIKAIAKEVESNLWSRVYAIQLRDKQIKDQEMLDGINDLFALGGGGEGGMPNTPNFPKIQLDDKTGKITQKKDPPQIKNRLDLKRQLRLLGPFLSTMALNIGTMEKFRQLGSHPQLYTSRAARAHTAREKRLIEELGRRARALQKQAQAIEIGKAGLDILIGLGLLRSVLRRPEFLAPISIGDTDLAASKIATGQLSNVHIVEWVTAEDDRVCTKYCLPLQGQRFVLEDTDTPIPIRDTHLNCRCRLLAVDTLTNGVFAA
jgi:hypothetical protein